MAVTTDTTQAVPRARSGDAAAAKPWYAGVMPWARRITNLLVLLFSLTTLLFFLLRVAGDPALVLAGNDASPEQLAAIRAAYGLDRPLIIQYFAYMGNLLTLDLGNSLASGQPAFGEVMSHLPATLLLAALAMSLTITLAILIGAWMGFRPDAPSRRLTAWMVFIMQGVPGYVFALLLIQVFAVQLRWLPSLGYGSIESWILPACALASFLTPGLTRVIAANVAEAMREDYIRTARANGATPREILFRHALPNALLGAAALIGAQFAFLMAGTVTIEMIFAWPGIGWLLLKSTQTLDFPVVQAVALVVAFLVYLVNLLTDLSFKVLDPRLRNQRA